MGEKKDLAADGLEIKSGRVLIDRGLSDKTEINLSEDESCTILFLPEAGVYNKEIDLYLKGDRSKAEILGLVLGGGRNVSRLSIKTVHLGKGTSAYTHVRGALFDESQAFFSGMIKIAEGADKTSSLLENRVLLLGNEARADSLPSLEIEANDVKASHAATVGRIDDRQLFYLESRGINRRTAVRMIVEGFFEPIFDRLKMTADEKIFAEVRGRLWVDLLGSRW